MSVINECEIDHYCPEGTVKPIKCPEGTFNAKQGSSTIDDCLEVVPTEPVPADSTALEEAHHVADLEQPTEPEQPAEPEQTAEPAQAVEPEQPTN